MRSGDLDALKEVINDLFRAGEYDCNSVLKAIDNAPEIETDIEVIAKDAYEHGYTDGWKERFGEPDEISQGDLISRSALK